MLNQWADLRNSAVFLKLNSIEIAYRCRFAFVGRKFQYNYIYSAGSHGVMVSTLDSESCDPSSNIGGI